MSSLRFKALEMLSFKDFRKDNAVTVPAKLSELFCQNVFSEETMREYLTKDAFTSIQNAIKKGTKIQRDVADQIAVAMKDWALSKGVTHYTHWFQPLTGATAENEERVQRTPYAGGLPLLTHVAQGPRTDRTGNRQLLEREHQRGGRIQRS